LLGAGIGFEQKWRRGEPDPRAAQVVSGIGLLGAGIIFRED
jgi:hypothetical protein